MPQDPLQGIPLANDNQIQSLKMLCQTSQKGPKRTRYDENFTFWCQVTKVKSLVNLYFGLCTILLNMLADFSFSKNFFSAAVDILFSCCNIKSVKSNFKMQGTTKPS